MEPASEPMTPEAPKSNKTLIIAVAVVLVLCCYCVAIVAGSLGFRMELPYMGCSD